MICSQSIEKTPTHTGGGLLIFTGSDMSKHATNGSHRPDRRKHDGRAPTTPATMQLERAGIHFHTYIYEHSADHFDEGYGLEAALKLGFNADQIYKTLMVDVGERRVIGIVPVSRHLHMKALAAAVGAKKATLADPKVAQRESGYVVGGISPFGQRIRHQSILDAGALRFDEILMSGGRRGFDIGVSPTDALKVLHATTAPIATPE